MRGKLQGSSPILLALGVGWGAGNVGPVAGPLASDFHVSLAGVGLLSGTVYFAALMLATPLAVPLASRLGVARASAVATATMVAGNALFAASPAFASLLAARILVGIGCAVALIAGPVMARELGGVRLLGLFGGAITLGIAAALGLGSVLQNAGVSWRVGFWISAAVCAMPLAALPARMPGTPAARPDRAFVVRAARSGAVWRLLALFVAANGVPLIVSAWFVAYLTAAGIRTAVAGALAFGVFGLTTLVRPLGARLAGAGRAFGPLAAGGSALACAGLLVFASATSLAGALIAVGLMGVGFALPYAVMVDSAQRLFPGQATATLAVVQTGPNVVPMLVIPLVGSALDSHHAPLAFALLGAFVAVAGALNVTAPHAAAERAAVPTSSA